jgi:hypothetical protein
VKAGATATLAASSSGGLTNKGKGKGKESLNEMSRSASQRNILDAIQATDSIESMRVTGGTGRWFQCLQQRKRGTGITCGREALGDTGSITPEGESDDEHEPHMRRRFHPAGGATPVSPVRLTLAYELARVRTSLHALVGLAGSATGE